MIVIQSFYILRTFLHSNQSIVIQSFYILRTFLHSNQSILQTRMIIQLYYKWINKNYLSNYHNRLNLIDSYSLEYNDKKQDCFFNRFFFIVFSIHEERFYDLYQELLEMIVSIDQDEISYESIDQTQRGSIIDFLPIESWLISVEMILIRLNWFLKPSYFYTTCLKNCYWYLFVL